MILYFLHLHRKAKSKCFVDISKCIVGGVEALGGHCAYPGPLAVLRFALANTWDSSCVILTGVFVHFLKQMLPAFIFFFG